jgi:hypothetical protein
MLPWGDHIWQIEASLACFLLDFGAQRPIMGFVHQINSKIT